MHDWVRVLGSFLVRFVSVNGNVIVACAVGADKVIVIAKPELHSDLSNVSKPGFLTLHIAGLALPQTSLQLIT